MVQVARFSHKSCWARRGQHMTNTLTTGENPAPDSAEGSSRKVEVSVVIPCLNEAETLALCIRKAQESLQQAGISGEVIVADNGSTDESPRIAAQSGAHLIHISERGYGNALMGGIAAARGEFLVMGDADDSYDFRDTPRFIAKLKEGFDLVQGCRLPAGGGSIMPGAMPFLHRWIGNPLLSRLARFLFDAPVHDVYCGMRAFRKDLYDRLNLRCEGMEFATEMIVKSRLFDAAIAEIPITLYPDGRRSRRPHVRTFHDGWRTLRFYLVYSPRWVFMVPGVVCILSGLIGYLLAMPGLTISGATLDAHTLLFASAAIMVGYQAILFAVLAKEFAVSTRLLPEDMAASRIRRNMTLERMLMLSALVLLSGMILLAGAVYQWWLADFGPLDYARTMRWVIPGVLLTVLGFQNMLAGFFSSVMRMGHRQPQSRSLRDSSD